MTASLHEQPASRQKYRQILPNSSSTTTFEFKCSGAWLLREKGLNRATKQLTALRLVTWEQGQWELWSNIIYTALVPGFLLHNIRWPSTPHTNVKYRCGNQQLSPEDAITPLIISHCNFYLDSKKLSSASWKQLNSQIQQWSSSTMEFLAENNSLPALITS